MNRFKLAAWVLLLVVLLVSVSCARAPSTAPSTPSEARDVGKGGVVFPVPAPALPPTPTAPAPPQVIVAPPAPSPVEVFSGQLDTERRIVRSANVQLVVNDVPGALDQIAKLALDFGGYVVSSNRFGQAGSLSGSIVFRVPVESFDNALRALRGLAVEVTNESTTSQDVSEEYADLGAKLRNLEATEEQLLRLLEKAEKVEDILSVQRELSRVRGEIEQTKGRMLFLERTSDTSLIQVFLQQSRLEISFVVDKRSLRTGQKVQFNIRQIEGGFEPYTYEWDFGDGNTSADRDPTHTYKTVGNYTVSLKVTDDRGNTTTETRSEYVIVLPGWSANLTASNAWNGMVTFGHALANVFIWVGIFSPVWIVVLGIAYWYWRHRRKKKA